jgi:predicted DNA-binding transcriptional regulator YafY
MARTLEIVRQWQLLQALDAAARGLTIQEMASVGGCTTRTIRRDLAALQDAGFPLYDERTDDGAGRWRMDRHPLKGLGTSFRLTELLALYFSRTLLETMVGSPFRDDVKEAFERFEAALPPSMKHFLEKMPVVVKAKPARMKLPAPDPRGERMGRLMHAMLNRREIEMRYASVASGSTKAYVVHPYRLAYADGGLYLSAFVPAYDEVRTFAVERIRLVSQLDTKFTVGEPMPPAVFPHSLGVHSGRPEKIIVRFAASVAAFVSERQWHASQRSKPRPDGGLDMELKVCRDAALRSWILGFGPEVLVLAPAAFAREIADALREAQAQYQPAIVRSADSAPAGPVPVQRTLPFPPPMRRLKAS